MSALIQRINRRLWWKGEQINTTRGDWWRNDLGDYHIHNWRFGWIVAQHVDPEALGLEIGVLQRWERLETQPRRPARRRPLVACWRREADAALMVSEAEIRLYPYRFRQVAVAELFG